MPSCRDWQFDPPHGKGDGQGRNRTADTRIFSLKCDERNDASHQVVTTLIPRRLYEHVRTHNWFAVVVDFVIVVVGVFIGIQVSNWNEERHERDAAKIYVERIREDIAASARNTENLLQYYRLVRTQALAALDGFDRPENDLGEQFLYDAYKASTVINRRVERKTYDEILSAGAMNLIRNLEVRSRLGVYYKSVAEAEELVRNDPPYRDNLRRHMPYPVQAVIFERCYGNTSLDARGGVWVTSQPSCELGLPSETIKAAVAAIRIPELKLDLIRRIAELDYNLRIYQNITNRGQVLDQFLAEAEI